MKLSEYKTVFIIVGIIGVVLIALPGLESVVQFPSAGQEAFSELYLLGPGRTAEGYPSTIATSQVYWVYAGVGDHLGQMAYYTVSVKLLNATDSLPNATLSVPSPVAPIYEYKVVVVDNQTLESLFTFSFGNLTSTSNQTAVLGGLTVNGAQVTVNKPAAFDSTLGGYQYDLVFELWLYNSTTNSIQYHNRFVDLILNYPSSKA